MTVIKTLKDLPAGTRNHAVIVDFSTDSPCLLLADNLQEMYQWALDRESTYDKETMRDYAVTYIMEVNVTLPPKTKPDLGK